MKTKIRPIVLLTDFGRQDPFAGILKGVIACISPESNVIDLTHEVNPQDILQGAFLLASSYSYFPRGSVFCVVVDPGVGSTRKGILIETRDYLFLGPDNGVLWHAADKNKIKRIFHLTNSAYFLNPVSATFHGRDIFAPVAAHVSKGLENISVLGHPIKECVEYPFPGVEKNGSSFVLTILHIDRFGNAVLNIDAKAFRRYIKDKRFCLTVHGTRICLVYDTYAQAPGEEPFIIESSSGYMEISVKNANAAAIMGIHCMDTAVLDAADV